MNAGSTTADSAAVTETNGDWGNAAANRFTAASGTPFSATQVGEWASIYLDGTTSGAVYVAQVTAVNGGGASIDLSTTAKYGTAPTTGATGRSCKTGGAWAGFGAVNSVFNSAGVNLPASTRVNVKAGTYANTTANLLVRNPGAATIVGWLRGYNATPGDIDTNQSLAKPLVTFTTGFLQVSGVHWLVSNFDFTGQSTIGAVFVSGGTGTQVYRCRIENTAAHASGRATTPNIRCVFVGCWFKATATADAVVLVANSNHAIFRDCAFTGGGIGLNLTGGGNYTVTGCVFRANGGDGISVNTTAPTTFQVDRCTFHGSGGDGIDVAVLPDASTGAQYVVANSLFASNTGYGINNSSGANTNLISRLNNDFYSNTAGKENGFGDSPSHAEQTESSSPVTSSTDMTPISTANAVAKGSPIPGTFENETYTSYLDIGAVQMADLGSGPLVGQGRLVG